jgi:putative endonuclease
MYFTYILWSETIQHYYTGSTQDVENRLSEHNNGESKSTRAGIPWEIVYQESSLTRSQALKKEKEIKARGASRYLDDHRKSK